MELGDANTCKQIRCGHLYVVDGTPACDLHMMGGGLFSCRRFDAAAERAEAYK